MVVCHNFFQYVTLLCRASVAGSGPQGNAEDRWSVAEVVEQVVGRIAELAQQKYSSNVVEACLTNAALADLKRMVTEISRPEVLNLLLSHKYGNYVVQRALTVVADVAPSETARLVMAIQPFTSILSTHAGGRNILEVIGHQQQLVHHREFAQQMAPQVASAQAGQQQLHSILPGTLEHKDRSSVDTGNHGANAQAHHPQSSIVKMEGEEKEAEGPSGHL